MEKKMDRALIDFHAEIAKAQKSRQGAEKIQEEVEKKAQKEEVPVEQVLANLPAQRSSLHGNVELVRIDDVALTTQGELTRTKYFDKMKTYRNETFSHMAFTAEEARKLSGAMQHLSAGVNSVTALQCNGSACVFQATCPYMSIGKPPIGLSCLVEVDLMQFHMERFSDDLQVDPNNHVEITLIQDLSRLIIQEMRVARMLAMPENASMLAESVKIDMEGREIIELKEHPLLNVQEKLQNRRMKLFEALLATRKAKAMPEQHDELIKSYGDMVDVIKNKIASSMSDTRYAVDAEYVVENK